LLGICQAILQHCVIGNNKDFVNDKEHKIGINILNNLKDVLQGAFVLFSSEGQAQKGTTY